MLKTRRSRLKSWDLCEDPGVRTPLDFLSLCDEAREMEFEGSVWGSKFALCAIFCIRIHPLLRAHGLKLTKYFTASRHHRHRCSPPLPGSSHGYSRDDGAFRHCLPDIHSSVMPVLVRPPLEREHFLARPSIRHLAHEPRPKSLHTSLVYTSHTWLPAARHAEQGFDATVPASVSQMNPACV
jgi:hypothetical protein